MKGSRGTRAVVVVGTLAVSAFSNAHAQTAAGRSESVPAGVSLIVRPRVGDTLWLQMEQTIEVSSRPTRTPLPDYGPRRARASTRITRLLLYAHSLVEASDLSVTTLLATTDSMAMGAGTPSATRQPQLLPLPMDGRQVRVRVTPDGAMRVNDPPPGAMELGATLAAMPGMLPAETVRVGDRWERDIVLPSLPVSGYRADGIVRARFRFDSLTRGGRDAWISMEGSLHRDGTSRDLPAGTRVITAGTMHGVLVVDRQRAWIVDARTVMDVQSEVSSGPGSAAAPVMLDLRIRQRVRVSAPVQRQDVL
ncbi:MAG: hypothetical protein IPP90_00085 [Gemmatimonadaceae bacterium]|nr:hypothetical protein [Gemmatimonadaceae bacterium]